MSLVPYFLKNIKVVRYKHPFFRKNFETLWRKMSLLTRNKKSGKNRWKIMVYRITALFPKDSQSTVPYRHPLPVPYRHLLPSTPYITWRTKDILAWFLNSLTRLQTFKGSGPTYSFKLLNKNLFENIFNN